MNLLEKTKEQGQDFEWYPTTQIMIDIVKNDIDSYSDILDIGAGDGRVLMQLKDKAENLYAIEKSQPLLQAMNGDIVILGTDFYGNTLIDKKVDVVFCNPPYSDYATWAKRIIEEANAKYAYLIIPQRWKDNEGIQQAIKDRNAEVEVLHNDDFLNAERKARAKVDIIKIDFLADGCNKTKHVEPFSLWFDKTFGALPEECVKQDYEQDKERTDALKNELVNAKDPIRLMLDLYQRDLTKLQADYIAITSLSGDVLKTININKDSLLSAFEIKIKGLKNVYWKELFNRMDKLTDRLTSWSRANFLQKMFKNTTIDFTWDNIHAIVGWVLKNAYQTLDEQIVEWYERMLDKTNCEAYKSNKKVFGSYDWNKTYCTDEDEKFIKSQKVKLLHRIIINYGAETSWSNERLSAKGSNYLNDIITLASEMGYKMHHVGYICDYHKIDFNNWRSNINTGEKYYLYSNCNVCLCEVKAFKNGNIHIKFNKEFITKINVIYGRLKGWIQNKEQADNEIGKGAGKHFDYKVAKLGNLLALDVDK